jgi:hypothetical protein
VTNGEDTDSGHDLRPVIARLKEIERKCESMGSRNEEFPMMKDKLARIIRRLEAGEEPSGEPLAYRDMARELFPIAHLFESVGFMSVGKEIAHIERSLRELAPETTSPGGSGAPTSRSPTSSAASIAAPLAAGESLLDRDKEDAEAERESMPKPILAGLVVLVTAILVAVAVVLEIGPFERKADPTPVPATPTAVPTPAPEPTPTAAPLDPNATPTSRERLADAISQARLAIRNGDLDAAVKHLSIAALTDRNDTSVIEVAERIVDELLRAATIAASETRWQDAAASTTQARTVAIRFDLDTNRIDAAERRFAEMERYRMVQPDDTAALRAGIGKRVEIKLEDGSLLVGRISRVTSANLVLEVEDDVGGGIVSFTDEVSRSKIRWVRIWED